MHCKHCNQDIPDERLEAIPDTSLCVSCSAEIGGDYEIQIVEDNLGSSIVSKPFVIKTKREIDSIND